MRMTKSKWFLPAFCLTMGVILFVASWIGDNPDEGLYFFLILAVFGLLVLLGGRSETVRGLRGDARDERFKMMDIHATAFAGIVVVFVLIGAWVVEIARGHDGSPYAQVMAVGGLAYLAAIGFMRWRG